MGIILWFTGLSGSGKTTLAQALKEELEKRGKIVSILDGDDIRGTYTRKLGFSREDIRENNRFIGELAKEKSVSHDFVLVPIISPYREDRKMARLIIGENFLEIFINCPLSVCENRDVKGLYKKARRGKIENFVGINEEAPYEEPLQPDITIRTDDVNKTASTELFLNELIARGYIT